MFSKQLPIVLLMVLFSALVAGQSPRLVDVGGYKLDALRAGAGTPVVILVAGLGNPLGDWARIWPSAAEFSGGVCCGSEGDWRGGKAGRGTLGAARALAPAPPGRRRVPLDARPW